jgi:putative peptide zinc metalloprotease protein
MNRFIRSRLTTLLPLIAAASIAVPLAAVRADDDPLRSSDDNIAIAVNTEDGTALFVFAIDVRKVVDGVVDETNIAAALASCTDCTTVAFAFQAVLVTRDADIVIPQNLALAFNDQCTGCFTYASATQLVFGFTGQVRISPEGRHRLHELERRLRALEDEVSDLTPAQLVAEIEAAEQELFAIFTEELVVLEPRRPSAETTALGDDGNAADEQLLDVDGPDAVSTTTVPPDPASDDSMPPSTQPPDDTSVAPDESVTTTSADGTVEPPEATTTTTIAPSPESSETTATTVAPSPDSSGTTATTEPVEITEPSTSEPVDTSTTAPEAATTTATTAVP